MDVPLASDGILCTECKGAAVHASGDPGITDRVSPTGKTRLTGQGTAVPNSTQQPWLLEKLLMGVQFGECKKPGVPKSIRDRDTKIVLPLYPGAV